MPLGKLFGKLLVLIGLKKKDPVQGELFAQPPKQAKEGAVCLIDGRLHIYRNGKWCMHWQEMTDNTIKGGSEGYGPTFKKVLDANVERRREAKKAILNQMQVLAKE